MDFFLKYLKETVETINKLSKKNIEISVKKIRIENNIEPTNRSKINFIWRSLEFLKDLGILEVIGSTSPKKYIIKLKEKINIDKIISQITQKSQS